MHNPRGSTLRRLTATGVVIAALAALPVLAPAAGAAEQGGGGVVQPTGSSPSGTTVRITLVTGDTVDVSQDAQGRESVQIVSAEGTSKTFQTMSGPDGDLYVIPDDASDALASQAVDRELFNVTRLIRDGYADTEADTLPVIVGYRDKPSDAALGLRAEALPASSRGALIETADMAGLRVGKKDAERFWQSVRPVTKAPKSGRTVTVPGASQVARVWYDGKVKSVLDKSVPQIGAPEVWAKGYDGTGVKVAVLDTGADLGNADIKDRITATQNFVPTATSVQDGQGHGTHVASTVLGSGANSGGKYKGVAPGADLMVGKVLNDSGSGDYSWVMNGMEWAAAQGADIVSMSLGGTAGAADDPVSDLVDRVSASSGTLFVIAAGNSGPSETTIGTPGIADAALTVGAVDKADGMAGFSSRGPRVGDYGIKPDITAPGVNIVAARAAGTAMGTVVDSFYTSASGTSMATPHVAGAAALLKQRHRDWDGQRIKMALTAQAKKGAGSVYDQGAGRVDVAAALDPGLEVSGTTDFGFVKWQEGAHETRTRTVTVTNPTDSATTVTPTLTGDLGAVTVSGPVTVAAHGSAEVTLTFDPNTAAIGKGSGSLVLTGSDGATAQTAVGYVKEPKRYRLKVVLKDRHNAAPSRVRLTVMGLDNSAYIVSQFAGSSVELTVPPGRYSIAGNLESSGPGDTTTSYATDLFSVPAVDLTGQDASVTVDGTKAQDFELKVRDEKRPLENSTFSYQISRAPEGFTRRQTYGISGLASWSQERFGAIPVAAPAEGDGILYSSFFQSRREPVLRATVTRPDTYSLTARTSSYLNRFSGKTGYDIVDVGGGTAEEIAAVDLKGKAALLHLPNYTISHSAKIKAVEAAGASAIILAPTQESTLGLVVLGVKVPLFDVPYEEGRRLTADVAAGRTTVDVEGVRESRYHYSGQTDSLSGIPSDLSPDTKKSDYAKLRTSYHSDGTGRMGYHITHAWGPYPMTSVQTAEFLWQGSERDDYVLARPTNTYATQLYARTDSAVLMTENARTYQPDTSASRDWFAPVMHPSAVPSYTCSFCRFDAGMVFQPQLGGDGDASHFVKSGLARTWKYYRDGELINVGEPLLVPGKARYTFESTNTRPSTAGGVNLGGKTVTAYTFDSAEPTAKEVADCELTLAAAVTCEALPVVQLDYRLDTSLLNKVAADSWYAVTVDASRVKPYTGDSRMAGAKFSVSYDDGATWKPAGVIRSDGHSFKAVFRHPELADTNGFVSIKAEAWDQAGNRTAQTVTRAYALK